MRALRLALILAIIAALAAGVVYYAGHRDDGVPESNAYIPKNAVITPELRLLQDYVRIDTSNPPGNEIAGARFLANLLAKSGVRAEIIESAPGRASIYARIKGKNAGGGLLLLHHIDVVPATPRGWGKPPFSAEIVANQLYGRGTLDMKGIGICELAAFVDVAKSGRVPEHDLVFLGVADEETGGKLGTEWLVAHRPDIFDGIRYALNEGGITEMEAERITYFAIEVGSKMLMNVRLRAATREQLQQTRIALEPFIFRRDPERILPEVRAFYRDIAPQRATQKALLADIDATVAQGKFWLLPTGLRELTQNVVWPGAVSKDGDGWLMDVRLFNLPDEQPDARLAWLRGIAAAHGARVADVLETMGPAPLSARNTPMFRVIEKNVRQVYGPVPTGSEILTASFNDSRFLRARGIDAYGMFPFAVDFFQTQGIHGHDERVRTDWFAMGVRVMRGIVQSYAFEKHD
jgi:acetylornithine deacetylase/succinyl-diaminopimelate desuccinylase-like protein